MKAHRLIAGAASVALVLLTVAGWAGSTASKGTTKVGAVSWANSFDEAKQRATKEGKPILHLQMFGNLGDEFC